MSNYCDEAFYQQNIYTNTYSLWENSAYYDINNLSPQNFSSSWHRGNDEDFETRYTSGPTEVETPEPPEPPDYRNRRTVDKASLYKDPDLFYQDVTEDPTQLLTPEWTQLHWKPASVGSEEGTSAKCNGMMVRTTRIQKKLDQMLSKPVRMIKGESMMQKMGWHGGSFGRNASGIMEPIAPNGLYAAHNTGFGQTLQPIPNTIKMEEYFTMNVLYHIYEFVKNNAEIELLFDKKLFKEERKRIHNIVQYMLNVDELDMVDFDSTAQMDVVLQICYINCYILQTQSEGEEPERRICIYKEAPAHVYLIIPDDLRDDPPLEDPSTESDFNPDEISDNELEEETNPFLISITRNLKKTKDIAKTEKIPTEIPPKGCKIYEKILEFFKEFSKKREFSQFKFLGPFNDEEGEAIRNFMEQAAQYLNNEPCDHKPMFEKISFEIGEDIVGNTVINKIPK